VWKIKNKKKMIKQIFILVSFIVISSCAPQPIPVDRCEDVHVFTAQRETTVVVSNCTKSLRERLYDPSPTRIEYTIAKLKKQLKDV
jgi:uncharacterized lipoprotein YajG